MRSSNFTFKKTVKKVQIHHGVCLDLTEGEARAILLLAEVPFLNNTNPVVGVVCAGVVKHLREKLDVLAALKGSST